MLTKNNGTKKPFWKKWWFWALIVAVLIGWVIEFTESETEEPATAVVEPTTESTATEEPTMEKNETEENIDTEKTETEKNDTEEIKDISAYELLTMEGHPVLYDYLSTAHTFWNDYADGRIDFPDDFFDDYKTDTTALVIDAYINTEHNLKDHMIRGFEIYPNTELSLQEGLDLVRSYLPMDILKKWYIKECGDCYYFAERNEYIYYMLYVPTEDGEKAIKELEADYNYACINIYVENDIIKTIVISSVNKQPRTGNLNRSEIQEWDYDFLKEIQ